MSVLDYQSGSEFDFTARMREVFASTMVRKDQYELPLERGFVYVRTHSPRQTGIPFLKSSFHFRLVSRTMGRQVSSIVLTKSLRYEHQDAKRLW